MTQFFINTHDTSDLRLVLPHTLLDDSILHQHITPDDICPSTRFRGGVAGFLLGQRGARRLLARKAADRWQLDVHNVKMLVY